LKFDTAWILLAAILFGCEDGGSGDREVDLVGAQRNVEVAHEHTPKCSTSPYAERVEKISAGETRLEVGADENVDVPGVEISVETSSGSSSSTTYVVMHDTRSGQTLDAEFSVDFTQMLNYHEAPEGLPSAEREQWLEMIEHAVFARTCAQADASLLWLLDRSAPVRWVAGQPTMPDNYTLRLPSGKADTGSTETWVEYLGFNHRRLDGDSIRDEFEVLDHKGDLDLLRSGHGAILLDRRRQAFAWIYVYGGGQKLRWPSVLDGHLTDQAAVLELSSDVSQRARSRIEIDLESGRFLPERSPTP